MSSKRPASPSPSAKRTRLDIALAGHAKLEAELNVALAEKMDDLLCESAFPYSGDVKYDIMNDTFVVDETDEDTNIRLQLTGENITLHLTCGDRKVVIDPAGKKIEGDNDDYYYICLKSGDFIECLLKVCIETASAAKDQIGRETAAFCRFRLALPTLLPMPVVKATFDVEFRGEKTTQEVYLK